MFRHRQRVGAGWQRSRLAAAVLASCLLLTGCIVSSGPAETEFQTLPAGSFSNLDEAGVEQIRRGKVARLDMSSGTLQKSAVRAENSYGPEVNTRGSGKINLTIVGPTGEVSGETDRIRFNTVETQPDFSEVTYFLTATSTEEYFELIRDGVERYGIDRDVAERWIKSAEKSSDFKSDFSLPSGFDTGLGVNYDLRYNSAKKTQVIIVHISPAD